MSVTASFSINLCLVPAHDGVRIWAYDEDEYIIDEETRVDLSKMEDDLKSNKVEAFFSEYDFAYHKNCIDGVRKLADNLNALADKYDVNSSDV